MEVVEKTAAELEAELVSELQLAISKDHTGPVNGLALNEKNSLVVSVSDDSKCIVFKYKYENSAVEEFAMWKHQVFECHSEEINGCSMDNEGAKLLSYGYDCKAVITDMATGKPIWQYQTEDVITAGHISPNGQFVSLAINGGRDLILVDTGAQSNGIHSLPNFHSSKTILCTRWSPNTSRMVSCGTDNVARLFDLRTSKATLVLKGHTNAVADAAFSSNEHWLATTSWDKTVALWSLSSGTFRHDGPSQFSRGHSSSVSCCSMKSDGTRIATGSYDKTICVWDSDSGNIVASLKGCDDWVMDIEMTQNCDVIFAASRDGTLRVFDVERASANRLAACGRRALGVTVVRCATCGKPYSIGDTTELDDVEMRYCVFCRLLRREKKKYLTDAKMNHNDQKKTQKAPTVS